MHDGIVTGSGGPAGDGRATGPVTLAVVGSNDRATQLATLAASIPGISITTSPASADGVIVALPCEARAAAIADALANGRPVFAETPLSLSRAEASRLVSLAAAENLPLYTASPARRALDSLGLLARRERPRLVECVFEEVRGKGEAEPDPVLDLMMGDLDAALALFAGPPVSLRATRIAGRPPRVDAVEGRIRCRGIGEIRLRADRNANAAVHSLKLHYGDGAIDIDLATGTVTGPESFALPPRLPDTNGLLGDLIAFARLVSGEETPTRSSHGGLAALDAALHLRGSLQAGL